MINKIYKSIKFSFIVSVILFPIILLVYYLTIIFNISSNKNVYETVKKNGLVYCYGLVKDSLIYVENLENKKQRNLYIKYYDSILSGNYCNKEFSSNSFFYGGPFYFKNVNNDSLLVEIYSIDTICWNIDVFLTYKKLIQRDPLPAYIQHRIDSINELNPPKISTKRNKNFCYQTEIEKLPTFIQNLIKK